MAGKSSKKRADLLLVDQSLAETRERAQALIMEGLVYTTRGKVLKPGAALPTSDLLELRGKLPYVSRGGTKLAHALDSFDLNVSDMVVLDVGASTGGFTDCVLQRGACKVFALDVGHGQLDYRLRKDPRIHVMERVNAHYPFTLPSSDNFSHSYSPSEGVAEGEGKIHSPLYGEDQGDVKIPSPLMGEAKGEGERMPIPSVRSGQAPSLPDRGVKAQDTVDLATIDVSFISVTKIIPSVAEHLADSGPLVVLVKPQFEAKREEVGRGGVIKDPKVHAQVLARVIVWVTAKGFRLRNLTPSPILGDAGNREFFLLLNK